MLGRSPLDRTDRSRSSFNISLSPDGGAFGLAHSMSCVAPRRIVASSSLLPRARAATVSRTTAGAAARSTHAPAKMRYRDSMKMRVAEFVIKMDLFREREDPSHTQWRLSHSSNIRLC
jgi:hypothetical protein